MSLEFTNFYIDTFEKALLPAATFPLRCNSGLGYCKSQLYSKKKKSRKSKSIDVSNSTSCTDQLMFTPDNASLEQDPAKVDLKTILVWGGTGGFGRVQGGRWVVT